MIKMRFTVLPVGQGTGTLIQVLDNNGDPESAIIIDLGSKFWKVSHTGFASGDFVEQELRKMKPGPTLNAIFLSHGDVDHINLIPRLIQKFKYPDPAVPRSQSLVIEKVWHGGESDTYTKETYGKKGKKATNVLTLLKNYRPTGKETNLAKFQADAITLAEPLYTVNGVKVFLLAGNAVSEETEIVLESDSGPAWEGSFSYLANLVSLVLVVEYGTPTVRRIVVTGDATGLTLANCNTQLFNIEDHPIRPVFSVTAPHHGSVVTTYDILGVTANGMEIDAYAQDNVNAFVEYLKPESVTVSAGEVDKYKLPSGFVIADFAKYAIDSPYSDDALNTKPPEHFYTTYLIRDQCEDSSSMDGSLWPKKAGWQTLRTTKAVYTTDYFRGDPNNNKEVPLGLPPEVQFVAPDPPYNPPPPKAAGWAFEIDQDGKTIKTKRVYDIKVLAAAERELIERQHGPLPPERFVLIESAPLAEPAPSPRPVSVRTTGADRAAPLGRRQARVLP